MINEKIECFENEYFGVNKVFLEKVSAMDQQTLEKELAKQKRYLIILDSDLSDNLKASSGIGEIDGDFTSYLQALLESDYDSILNKILSNIHKTIVLEELLKDEE